MADNALGQIEENIVVYGDNIDILVVEDNDSERESIVDSLQHAVRDVRVAAVHSGSEALDFLYGRAAWAHRAGQDPPRMILLDIAMPGTDGFSVLGQIRTLEPADALTLTPIVVFANSPAPEDIAKSYRCGANSYIIKPLSFPDFQRVVETIGQYWMNQNKTGR